MYVGCVCLQANVWLVDVDSGDVDKPDEPPEFPFVKMLRQDLEQELRRHGSLAQCGVPNQRDSGCIRDSVISTGDGDAAATATEYACAFDTTDVITLQHCCVAVHIIRCSLLLSMFCGLCMSVCLLDMMLVNPTKVAESIEMPFGCGLWSPSNHVLGRAEISWEEALLEVILGRVQACPWSTYSTLLTVQPLATVTCCTY